jgi:hypothetical protein
MPAGQGLDVLRFTRTGGVWASSIFTSNWTCTGAFLGKAFLDAAGGLHALHLDSAGALAAWNFQTATDVRLHAPGPGSAIFQADCSLRGPATVIWSERAGGNETVFGADVVAAPALPRLGAWTTRAQGASIEDRSGAVAINGLLYVFGTHSGRTWVHDPTSGTWTERTPRPSVRSGFGTALVNGIVYVIGGERNVDSVATVEAYDPTTDTWTSRTPMPFPRDDFATAVVGNRIYVIGGATNTYVPRTLDILQSVLEYDPVADSWTTKAPMPTPRWFFSASQVNGVIYAVGGGSGPGQAAAVEAFDPATNSWSTKAALPGPRYYNGTVALGGTLYAIGGEMSGVLLPEVYAYDPDTNAWSIRAPIPTPRATPAMAVLGGAIYVVGGDKGNNTGTFVQTIDRFVP